MSKKPDSHVLVACVLVACALVACMLVACVLVVCVMVTCVSGMCDGGMCVSEQSISVELCVSRCPVTSDLTTHCVRQTVLGLKGDFLRLL